MAGGQAIDLASVGQRLSADELRQMHRRKTGALLEASVVMGAVAAQATQATVQHLLRYGQALGVAFQVVDDILDVTADVAALGKTVGKDAANDKPTYVSLMGLEGARAEASRLAQEAQNALRDSGLSPAPALEAVADWVLQRQN
jgi:farnesyl diphosphate synthase